MVFTLRAAKQLDPKRYSEALNFIHLKSQIYSDLGASGMVFFFTPVMWRFVWWSGKTLQMSGKQTEITAKFDQKATNIYFTTAMLHIG